MANDRPTDGNWYEYQRLVLSELERGQTERKEINDRIDRKLDDMAKRISAIHDDVLTLKLKAGFWGGVVSFIIGLFYSIMGYFGK